MLKNGKTIAETIRQLKLDPCSDCGNTFHPVCMDFDHVRGEKLFNISAAKNLAITEETLLLELDKCDLTCANCHRLRTYYRIIDSKLRESYLNFLD